MEKLRQSSLQQSWRSYDVHVVFFEKWGGSVRSQIWGESRQDYTLYYRQFILMYCSLDQYANGLIICSSHIIIKLFIESNHLGHLLPLGQLRPVYQRILMHVITMYPHVPLTKMDSFSAGRPEGLRTTCQPRTSYLRSLLCPSDLLFSFRPK